MLATLYTHTTSTPAGPLCIEASDAMLRYAANLRTSRTNATTHLLDFPAGLVDTNNCANRRYHVTVLFTMLQGAADDATQTTREADDATQTTREADEGTERKLGERRGEKRKPKWKRKRKRKRKGNGKGGRKRRRQHTTPGPPKRGSEGDEL